ncbi:esterase [Mycolicibacterium phlei]
MQTVDYSPGRAADLYGGPADTTVLMWHGAQTDSRAAMRPLAERVHEHGVSVVLADWDSHADDRGRADLLASARFAAGRTERLVLAGWSMGGLAAAGLTLTARDVRVAHTVCLAGAFMVPDPISGAPLPDSLTGQPAAFTLLHGAHDDVVAASASADFAAVLRDSGWPVECAVLDADHGSIAGATYDPAADRYSAASDPVTLAVANDVAARIAAVC